jgi:hypothetical protein
MLTRLAMLGFAAALMTSAVATARTEEQTQAPRGGEAPAPRDEQVQAPRG